MLGSCDDDSLQRMFDWAFLLVIFNAGSDRLLRLKKKGIPKMDAQLSRESGHLMIRCRECLTGLSSLSSLVLVMIVCWG